MLLSDRDIRAELNAGRIGLEPLELDMVQPSSIDVRLDRFFRLFDNHKYPFIDPAEDQPELTRLIETKPDEPFILHPGEFVLGSTFELVSLPDDIAARLEGKSSLGRLGLLTHSTAGFVDPGFSGHVTLELSNVATLPIKLWPGMKIGQLCFIRTSSPVDNPYGSGAYLNRYQGQRGYASCASCQPSQGLKAYGAAVAAVASASGETHANSETSAGFGATASVVTARNTGHTSFSTIPDASTAR
jgi:dCTP deaminase